MISLSIHYKTFIYYYKGLNDCSGELELVGYVDNSGDYGDTNLNTAYKPTGYKDVNSSSPEDGAEDEDKENEDNQKDKEKEDKKDQE